MDGLLELSGIWLARAYALYGMAFLAIPSASFAYVLVLGAVIWELAAHSRGTTPWPWVQGAGRRRVRLGLEIIFGLINPVIYLAVFAPALPELRPEANWWVEPLTMSAWFLLAGFWALRLFGAAVDRNSRAVRAGVRTLLGAALVCVLAYTVKDALLLYEWSPQSPFTVFLMFLRLCPLYLIPAALLWNYLRAMTEGEGDSWHGLFLLPDRAARFSVAVVAVVALVTVGLAAHRRSDAAVRMLVSEHRDSILEAAARHDVDARLVASIVYVTHRDQLSPFRGALERLIVTAWSTNVRGYLGMRPPDNTGEGADENPLLNRAFDISVGLTQIKPRTAQTASVLATGRKPSDLPKPVYYAYMDVEPIGQKWMLPVTARGSANPKIPVPAERDFVTRALLDAQANLDTCALILSLYQQQWESANREWSLRGRPDVLATLYQIGFARSKPHGAPRSNKFGNRVRQVYEQPWIGELLAAAGRQG